MCMADRIKERRLKMGYTQEELANKLGLQKSAIAKYENGRVENIKRSVILKMANVLNCNPSYLMGWEKYSTGCEKYMIFEKDQNSVYIPTDGHGDYSEEEDTLLRTFSKLNENNRKKVLQYTENVLSIQTFEKEQEESLQSQHVFSEDKKSALEFSSTVQEPQADYLTANAAHERTDTDFTEEERKADEDMLD